VDVFKKSKLLNYNRELLTFNPNNHGHYYDGKRLLGVTTALSSISKGDGLVQWAVNQACDYARNNVPVYDNEPYELPHIRMDGADFETVLLGAKFAWKAAREEAASIGTQAHEWIEAHLKGLDPAWPENPQVANSCQAALDWIGSVHWETLDIERQIYIPELEVAGICDWYARIDGVLAVPDWKTSKSLHSTYAYQTAAYLRALEAEFGEKIPHRWLIRIDKETGVVEPRFLEESTIEPDYAAFESAVCIYRREAEIKKEWQNTKSGSWTSSLLPNTAT
jgi:hypothetical protein